MTNVTNPRETVPAPDGADGETLPTSDAKTIRPGLKAFITKCAGCGFLRPDGTCGVIAGGMQLDAQHDTASFNYGDMPCMSGGDERKMARRIVKRRDDVWTSPMPWSQQRRATTPRAFGLGSVLGAIPGSLLGSMPGGFVASYFGNIDDSPIQVGAGTGAVIGALTVGTYFAIVNNRDKTSIEGSIASISEVVGRIREIGADSFYHFRVKTAQKETKAKREARLIDLSAAAYEIAQGASTPPSP